MAKKSTIRIQSKLDPFRANLFRISMISDKRYSGNIQIGLGLSSKLQRQLPVGEQH